MPEAHFALAKILFYKNSLNEAVEEVEKSIECLHQLDTEYLLWASFICYTRFIVAKSSENRKTYGEKAQKYALACLKIDPNNNNCLFILLFITLKLIEHKAKLKIKPRYSPEDLAVKIKENNEFLGYLAWAEVKFQDKKTVQFGINILQELVMRFPNNLETYIRLWVAYDTNRDEMNKIETANKMFILGTSFLVLETK